MRRRNLGAGWVVGLAGPPTQGTPAELVGQRYPADVPGCVHTDLMSAGVIADPLLDDNERATAWVGRQDWDYRHELWWHPDGSDRQELVFDGLDTAAEIWLNGERIGQTANMHRTYRFDVTGRLHDGSNPLTVRFESAWSYAERIRARLGDRPAAYPTPFNFIRKMACSFGWDWGPQTVTAGIWRPVALETWSTARLASVRPEVTVDAGSGHVRVLAKVDHVGRQRFPLTVRVQVTGLGTDVTGARPARTDGEPTVVSLEVAGARRWWPRGLGDQPLYALRVDLVDDAGERLDSWVRQIGFREVAISTGADDLGTGFTIEVNRTPVDVRGVNWIPDDVFPHRVTPSRYAERLGDAVEAGANLVRVWGGGRYESQDFYDACDRLGLLVWQDFAFACAAYPEEEPFATEVDAEAREVVERLMPHPSLTVWNGNNENFWGFHDWGWAARLGGRTWGEGFYLDVLPGVVAEVDPTRPYWPGSPYSDRRHHPNDDAHGVAHEWAVWNELDYPAYRLRLPRFVAEFGWPAPAAWSTLVGALRTAPQRWDSPAIRLRQRAIDGERKLARGLERFGLVDSLPSLSLDDWLFLTQVVQARALTTAIEHYRSHPEVCHGVIWWQLNDCWPAISWSLVDSAGRRKPAWYALRDAYADTVLTLEPTDGLTVVVVAAGGAQPSTGRLSVSRRMVTGEVLASYDVDIEGPPGRAVRLVLPSSVAAPERPEQELVVAELAGRRALWWFVEDHDLDLPTAELSSSVEPREGGYDVRVQAHTLVRELCLFADRLDPSAQADRQLVTLLPGEQTVFSVDTAGPADARALTTSPVLRATNDAQLHRARLRSDSSRRLVGADRKGIST